MTDLKANFEKEAAKRKRRKEKNQKQIDVFTNQGSQPNKQIMDEYHSIKTQEDHELKHDIVYKAFKKQID